MVRVATQAGDCQFAAVRPKDRESVCLQRTLERHVDPDETLRSAQLLLRVDEDEDADGGHAAQPSVREHDSAKALRQ